MGLLGAAKRRMLSSAESPLVEVLAWFGEVPLTGSTEGMVTVVRQWQVSSVKQKRQRVYIVRAAVSGGCSWAGNSRSNEAGETASLADVRWKPGSEGKKKLRQSRARTRARGGAAGGMGAAHERRSAGQRLTLWVQCRTGRAERGWQIRAGKRAYDKRGEGCERRMLTAFSRRIGSSFVFGAVLSLTVPARIIPALALLGKGRARR
jgi:hypothetical protein